MGQSRFEEAAKTWDEDERKVQTANNIAKAILSQIPTSKSLTAADFGCGTGLVTLALSPHLGKVIGIDSSSAMLSILQDKLQNQGVANVETLLADFETKEVLDITVDLIFSSMTFHHIADVPSMLGKLSRLLKPKGFLAIADLDSEDGGFHSDKTGVRHFGFDRSWLMDEMTRLGYVNIKETTAHTVERPTTDGDIRAYPVFLISGQR